MGRAGRQYDGEPLRSIAKGEVDLAPTRRSSRPRPSASSSEQEFAGLLDWLGDAPRTDSVKEVRLSTRLTTSPACLVGDAHDLTPTLEKMYRAMGQEVPHAKRILELNPGHPLVTGLRKAHEQGERRRAALTETAELLYGLAVLAEGGELADPARFTRTLADRLARTL